MKNNKKKFDIDFKTIWKWLRSENGKRYSFIIFYIFFFIFLFIFLTVDMKPIINNEIKEENSLPFSTKNLENNDYEFSYIINSNDVEEYKGKKQNNQISLMDDRGVFAFIYQDGKLIRNDNLEYDIPYSSLIDIYEIKRIIKNSKLISETKLNETNEIIYNYVIKNSSLESILNDNIDNLDLENEIVIKTNSKHEIYEINFNFLNYVKSKNNELSNYKIIIKYGDINE